MIITQAGRSVGKTETMNTVREARAEARRAYRPRWVVYHVTTQKQLVSGLFRLEAETNRRGPVEFIHDTDTRTEMYSSSCMRIPDTDDRVLVVDAVSLAPAGRAPFEVGSEGCLLYLHTYLSQTGRRTAAFGWEQWVFRGHVYRPNPAEVLEALVLAEIEGHTGGVVRLDEMVVLGGGAPVAEMMVP